MRALSRRGFLAKLALSPFLLEGCAPRLPLRVAAHPWVGYEPMFLARQHGWLDGSRVRLVETPTATDSLHLLGSGLVEAAALTLDEVLRARALGLPLAVVMVFDVSAGADGVLARRPMQLAELRGARVGLEQSAVGALMLAALLERGSLGLEEVQTVHLGFHEHATAWRAGRIDTLITFEPLLSELETGGTVRIFDSRAIPDTIVDVLAVHSAVLTPYRPQLSHLIHVTLRAAHDLSLNRLDAAYRMGARLHQRPETVLAGLRGVQITDLPANRRLLGGAAPLLLQQAHEVMQILQRAGLLPAGEDHQRERLLADLINAEFLPLL